LPKNDLEKRRERKKGEGREKRVRQTNLPAVAQV